MEANEMVVRVRNLTKQYGDQQILKGLDLDILAGETYALLGPNGAGKSTTIEILEGFRRPDGGEISVLGAEPLKAGRDWKAKLGIVSQTTGDFGPYTARELLRKFAGIYPNPRGVEETLELVGLTEHANRRANKLSGGQQRRVDVALGIIGRPKLLFLDEPTTGFDPEARRKFWGMLRGLQLEGTAILLTTHYLDEAAYLADRVGVVTSGIIAAEAPPALLGGADARTPIVRWRDRAGELTEVRTEDPAALVSRIYAETAGEPAELEIVRPSLEDIYLQLINSHSEDSAHRENSAHSEQIERSETHTEGAIAKETV